MKPRIEPGARPLSRLYALLFLAAICVPALRLAAGEVSQGAARERRRAARVPTLTASAASWRTFPRRFEEWYANQFGFRDELMRQHNLVKWVGLRSSPSDTLTCGRDGWVFYSGNETLEQVRGARPFEPGEVEAWLGMLEERRAWLAERGARYLFAIAPVKSSIYPDFLPAGYEPVGPARFDQLAEALARSEVPFLDLRAPLIDERTHDRGGDLTYYPLGTHWTRRGALRAWREIVGAVPELFETGPPPLDEIPRVLHATDQGDSWGDRLYLEDHLRQEVWTLSLGPTPAMESLSFSRQGARYTGSTGPRVVFFHDSFGSALRPQLARSCASLTCFWRYMWELAYLEETRPDLVVDLFVERTLVTLDPAAMPLPTAERLAARFDAASTVLWSVSGDDLGEPVEELLPGYRVRALPDLEGPDGASCWIAAEVESRSGGLVELALRERGAESAPEDSLRRAAKRAFLPPGRSTVVFEFEDPPRRRQVLLGSELPDWSLLRAEARSAPRDPRR